MSHPRAVVILGSTGSVGTQALDVVRRNPDLLRVVGLAAGGTQLDRLAAQAVEFGAEVVGVSIDAPADCTAALEAAGAGRTPDLPMPKVLTGPDAASEIACWPLDVTNPRDGVVLNAMTGSIGLAPTLAALRAGRTLALANKESLIVGGPLVKAAAEPGQLVPVDSEHSAIAQCLRGERASDVRKLVVTASGGPFRGLSRAQLRDVTPAQALAHPTWRMGPVITVNSATLVNKGLEVIEAHLLFDLPFDRIEVVVHPQSLVHSMVEFADGSTMAQVSPADMRLPIALALRWPQRVTDAIPALDWSAVQQLTFEPLDDDTFPAVRLARRVGELGGIAPAVYNAANEEAVGAFLAGRLAFGSIVEIVEQVVAGCCGAGVGQVAALDDVLDAERVAREHARAVMALRGDRA